MACHHVAKSNEKCPRRFAELQRQPIARESFARQARVAPLGKRASFLRTLDFIKGGLFGFLCLLAALAGVFMQFAINKQEIHSHFATHLLFNLSRLHEWGAKCSIRVGPPQLAWLLHGL
jgi:hypothetical protein